MLFTCTAAIQPGVHGVNRGSPEPARPHPGGVLRPAISERDIYLTEQVILYFLFCTYSFYGGNRFNVWNISGHQIARWAVLLPWLSCYFSPASKKKSAVMIFPNVNCLEHLDSDIRADVVWFVITRSNPLDAQWQSLTHNVPLSDLSL